MFLQEKENLTRMIIAKLKEIVLRDMHATTTSLVYQISYRYVQPLMSNQDLKS